MHAHDLALSLDLVFLCCYARPCRDSTHTHTHMYIIHAYTHTDTHTRVHTCAHAHMHTQTHTHTHIHVHTHTQTHTHTRTHTHTNAHIHTHTNTATLCMHKLWSQLSDKGIKLVPPRAVILCACILYTNTRLKKKRKKISLRRLSTI